MDNVKKSICWISVHSYEIHKELELKNSNNSKIGIVIVNRCVNCGKINHTKVRTVDSL